MQKSTFNGAFIGFNMYFNGKYELFKLIFRDNKKETRD